MGQTAKVGDYDIAYRKITADPQNERISFAAQLDVTKNGKHVATLNPARNYYPTLDPTAGAIGRYFMGESTSEVGLKTGAGGDIWTAFQPTLSSLNPAISRGNRELAGLPPQAQGFAILALVQHYLSTRSPRTSA